MKYVYVYIYLEVLATEGAVERMRFKGGMRSFKKAKEKK
jgi:hypothetical protein